MLNWLLVGAGDIARKRVAPALAETAGSHLYAVCDIDRERAVEIAGAYHAEKMFTDFRAALDDESVDAVYIATPVGLHTDMAVEALGAGKHVMVEKPLGLSTADAEQVVDAAKETDAVAGCAYFRRFFPSYRLIEDMLENGEFGKIVLVRMTYFSWFDPSPADPKYWRVVRERSGGGPIADMGSHMFDFLIGLCGLPSSVFAKTSALDRDWDVEDTSAMVMSMPSGAPVTASFNWNSKTWVHLFEIVGTEAKVLLRPFDGETAMKTVGRDIWRVDVTPPENVHKPLLEDFVAAVAEGRKPLVSLESALDTNRLMDAVYRSASEGEEVDV